MTWQDELQEQAERLQQSIESAPQPLDPYIAKLALVQQALGTGSGGGGGGGITQSEVKGAIESATNIDNLETLLTAIATNTSIPLTQAQVKGAIEAATNLDTLETLLNAIATNTAGGGGGITQAQVKAAIESATNLDGLEASLTTIAGNTASPITAADVQTGIDNSSLSDNVAQIASNTSTPLTQAQVKAAIESATNLDGLEASLTTIATNTGAQLTQAQVKAAIESATNIDGLETPLGNINTNTAAVVTRLGEVQDAPTAYTVLDRLKSAVLSLMGTTTPNSSNNLYNYVGSIYATVGSIFDSSSTNILNFLRDLVANARRRTVSSAGLTAGGVNATATITLAAVGASKNVIHGVAWSLSADPASAVSLLVLDGGSTTFQINITKGGAGFIPVQRKNAAVNTSMTVQLGAGGAGVTGLVSILECWVEA